ncbi:MAG: hypothetical protein NTY53_23580 [Kiritimatiellaeota bacterium]|nr:hypothetical protein [Kiritimatiellota bacterium]
MSATPRFVLLRHEGHGPNHFDFMIEDGHALATWQFDSSPTLLSPGGALTCRRLAEHRSAYLDYEGPVSGGRGSVQREDSGACHIFSSSDSCWNFAIKSAQQLRGKFILRRVGNTAAWTLTRD